jgi:hypothetical protein
VLVMIVVVEGGFDQQMTPVIIEAGDGSSNVGGVCM